MAHLGDGSEYTHSIRFDHPVAGLLEAGTRYVRPDKIDGHYPDNDELNWLVVPEETVIASSLEAEA